MRLFHSQQTHSQACDMGRAERIAFGTHGTVYRGNMGRNRPFNTEIPKRKINTEILRLKTNIKENLLRSGFTKQIYDIPVYSKLTTKLVWKHYTVYEYNHLIDVYCYGEGPTWICSLIKSSREI